ncbi:MULTISPECIES: hypothetical protein [Photorhabdus]|nr:MULTISPECIES: hypothetical protein [Photorhabdus]
MKSTICWYICNNLYLKMRKPAFIAFSDMDAAKAKFWYSNGV